MDKVALRRSIVPEPFKFAAHTVKVQIRTILEVFGTYKYKLYLSPADRNIFRYQVAKTLPYKGNRKAPKPIHYAELRKYMEAHHPTVCMPGLEADDAMGIDQDKENNNTVICSIDKDMLQIPGEHYNFVTGEFMTVDELGHLALPPGGKKLLGSGLKWFYAQMLLGDRCDNIQGIKGYGPVATYNLLDDTEDEEQLEARVFGVYVHTFKDEAKAIDRFYENADLLWILRKPEETYTRRPKVMEMSK